MEFSILKIVEYLKALAYLAVTVSVGYTYVNKDNILSKIGDELKPNIQEQVRLTVKKEVPIALRDALQQDNMHITIDSNQFRMFQVMLDENKYQILEASAELSEKFSKLALNDFLSIERTIYFEDGTSIIIKGTLIGKNEEGLDDWVFRIKENKT